MSDWPELDSRLDRIEQLLQEIVGSRQPAGGLLTLAEVAKRFGVSEKTVYRLVESGKLTASRIGKGRGTLRFDPAHLERFQLESTGALIPRRGRWPSA